MRKNVFLSMAGAAILAFGLTSCEKEQSTLDIGAVKTTSFVTGYVEMSDGFKWDDVASMVTFEDLEAASGVKVILEIANSDFDSDITDGSTMTYETTTDEDGFYSFEVKVNPNGTASNVIVAIPAFEKEGSWYPGGKVDDKTTGPLVYEYQDQNLTIKKNVDAVATKFTLVPTAVGNN